MTEPALAAGRFAVAVLIGAGLGVCYGFLRPLRPKFTHLADLLFVILTFFAWVYLGFGICLGDLRFAYTAGLLAGAIAWEMTVGKWLRPVFSWIWGKIGKIFHIICLPVEKILHLFQKICKKLFANRKKWVTIKGTIRTSENTTGGERYGTPQKEKIPPGAAKKPPGHLGLHFGGRGRVHRGADHSAGQHRRQRRPV